jgi:hypothetical protein
MGCYQDYPSLQGHFTLAQGNVNSFKELITVGDCAYWTKAAGRQDTRKALLKLPLKEFVDNRCQQYYIDEMLSMINLCKKCAVATDLDVRGRGSEFYFYRFVLFIALKTEEEILIKVLKTVSDL